MAEIGLVASVIAVIQIATAVTTHAYQYGMAFKNAKSDIEAIISELNNITLVLDKLRALAEEAEKSRKCLDNWPALIALNQSNGPLEKSQVALKAILEELSPKTGWKAKVSEKAKWAWKKEKIEGLIKMITKQKNTFIESLEVDHVSQSLETGHVISDAQLKTQKRDIIQWLSNTNHSTSHEAARKKHEDLTGSWLIMSAGYAKWINHPNSFLWLYGIPGCGKTILCSEIIERAMKDCGPPKNFRLAYFYFTFQDREKQKAANMPRSLLAQLAHQIEILPEELCSLHERYQYGVPPANEIMDILRGILAVGNTFIIIDALDECPSTGQERDELCSSLEKIHSWNCQGLHLLVTSRYEPNLIVALENIVTQTPISIHGAAVDEDIRTFIRSQLASSQRLKKWPKTIQSEIEKTLVKKAHGMFRWVFCQFDSLAKCLTVSEVRNTLDSLPKTLDETYERIFTSIPDEHRPKAISALMWIAYSRRPLTLKEIAEAAVLNAEEIPRQDLEDQIAEQSWILEVLPGIITLDNGSGIDSDDSDPDGLSDIGDQVAELAHFSVIEYLESSRILRGSAHVYYMNQEKGNIFLSRVCLQSLKAYMYRASEPRDTGSSFRGRLATLFKYKCSDLEAYMLTYWGEIFEELTSLSASALMEPLISTLRLDTEELLWALITDKLSGVIAEDPLAYALYNAVCKGFRNIIRLLLDYGVSIDTVSRTQGTLLQSASRYSRIDVAVLLLHAGANVNVASGKIGTPLNEAAMSFYGSPEKRTNMVRLLLDFGADANLVSGSDKTGALHEATKHRNIKMMQCLLEAGADVNLITDRSGTALQIAARSGTIETVETLLNAGADPNIKKGNSKSAIVEASTWAGLDYITIVLMLLGAGAKIDHSQTRLLASEWAKGEDADIYTLAYRGGGELIGTIVED